MLPLTAKRRITTTLKSKNNQHCQKIELCRSPTTQELKKEHSSRQVRGAEVGSWMEEDTQPSSGWQTVQARWRLLEQVVPHLHMDKPRGTTGE